MASLEELLLEEGFKAGKMMWRSRTSFKSDAAALQKSRSSAPRRQSALDSAAPVIPGRTQRTRSDVSWLGSGLELQKSEGVVVKSGKDTVEIEIVEETDFNEIREDEIVSVGSSDSLQENSMCKAGNDKGTNEKRIIDDQSSNGMKENEKSRERFSNELLEHETLDDNGNESHEKERDEERGMGIPKDGRRLISEDSSKSRKNSGYHRRSRRRLISEPALDEAAVQAMISIISGYVRRYPKDKTFRDALRQNCLSCLISTGLDGPYHVDSGVVVNFRHAAETVERVTEKSGNPKELKKATLQLRVIAGLNSKDLIDGFTSGISNSDLAACAHLYLSVIYKLQKRDLISAKHLLQVFCDSPFQARTILLSDLWDQLFLPHLSHLRAWYDHEAEAISNTSSRQRKMKHLERVYTKILNKGTYQFAIYYKEWLTTRGIEVPTFPSILNPTISVCGASPGSSNELSTELEQYDGISIPSNKHGVHVVKDGEREESFSSSVKSLAANSEEVEGAGTCSPKPGTYMKQHIQQEPRKDTAKDASPQDDGLLLAPEDAPESYDVAVQDVNEIQKKSSNKLFFQNNSGSITHLISPMKANELTLKKLARVFFHLQQTPDSIPATDGSNISFCREFEIEKDGLASKKMNVDLPVTSSSAGMHGNYEYFEEGSFFSSIPKDFFCPLTGRLFEDPVTLETGQTYELLAIKEWFNQGNRTCPETGQTLASVALPGPNRVLKRVIDGWKSEHCRSLLAFATQIGEVSNEHEWRSKDNAAIFILEQLLTGLNTQEVMENAKRLISLGGLQFLIRRLELGNLEEKTRAAALLSCCIKADGSCRNYLARNVEMSCLIQLLHSKRVSSRTTAVFLLTELMCLDRRTTITLFLSGLQKEGNMNTLHVLLAYLQSSPPKQRSLVSVLLLHLDLMIEPQRNSIYGAAAVNTLVEALESSLTDEKVREQSCKALLILGGHFSYSGQATTETWLLNQAGFYDGYDDNIQDNSLQIDGTMPSEERESEEWLENMARLLLCNGKKPFLETISRCLNSNIPDLVRACLTTVAWISHELVALSDAEFHLPVSSSLISWLKECLENAQIEHRVLASMSLLNFSQISEYRVLLMTFAEEILAPLSQLSEVTWTAKQLLSIISGDPL